MTQAPSEKLVDADNRSSFLFDHLVDQVMDGNVRAVEVFWEDATDERGEPAPIPHVTIDGETADSYVRRPMEYTVEDTELIDLTAAAFELKVGSMWEGTKEAIEELDVALAGLATSSDAGYFDRARILLLARGTGGAGHDEVIATARQLATSELLQWSVATSAQAALKAAE